MANYTKIDRERAHVRELAERMKKEPPFLPPCEIPGCDDPGPKRFQNGRAFHCEKHSLELWAARDAKDEADRLKREERSRMFERIRAGKVRDGEN